MDVAGRSSLDEMDNWSSLLGIGIAIAGNVLISLALNVQRYAHTQLDRDDTTPTATRPSPGPHRSASEYGSVSPSDEERAVADPVTDRGRSGTYLRSSSWWLGQALITVGESGNFLAYGLAPASIVSPLGVVALVANCIIAPILFHERSRSRDFWGVAVSIAGVVTVVLSADQNEPRLGPHEIWDAITAPAFEIYMGITMALIIIIVCLNARNRTRSIVFDLGLAGLFGGYTALAVKGVSSMLSSILFQAFTKPITYLLLTVLIVTAILQVRYVNRALQRSDSTQVIPTQFVMFTLCVIIGSAVLYRDFERTTPARATKFIGGCFLTFIGVFLITNGKRSADRHGNPLSDRQGSLAEIDTVSESVGLLQDTGRAAGALSPIPCSRSSFRSSSPPSRSMRTLIDAGGFVSQHTPSSPRSHPSGSPAHPGVKPWTVLVDTTCSQALVPCPDSRLQTSTLPAPPGGVDAPISHTAGRQSASRANTGSPHPPSSDHSAVWLRRHGHHGHFSNLFVAPLPLSSTVTAVKDVWAGLSDSAVMVPRLRHLRTGSSSSLYNAAEHGDDGRPCPHTNDDVSSSTSLWRSTVTDVAPGGPDTPQPWPSRSVGRRGILSAIGNFFFPSRHAGSSTKDIGASLAPNC